MVIARTSAVTIIIAAMTVAAVIFIIRLSCVMIQFIFKSLIIECWI